MEEQEYDVESIIQARVSSKRAGKVHWQYLVKWKGYSMDENTWEPRNSFEGSDNLIDAFWTRVDTGGRDINDNKCFKVGEELFPTGRKSIQGRQSIAKSERAIDPDEDVQVQGRISRLSEKKTLPASADGEIPAKRKRGRQSTPIHLRSSTSDKVDKMMAKKRKVSISRRNSFASRFPLKSKTPQALNVDTDIGTDADGEGDTEVAEDELLRISLPMDKPTMASTQDDEGIELIDVADTGLQLSQDESLPDPLFDSMSDVDADEPQVQSSHQRSSSSSNLPSHRARAANPLVKLVDEPLLGKIMNGAISVKARLVGQNASMASQASGSRSSQNGNQLSNLRPLPKNSLLTAQKGALTVIKGSFHPPIVLEKAPATQAADDGMTAANADVLNCSLIMQPQDEGAVDKADREENDDADTYRHLEPISACSGIALLKEAGLDEDAQALPDFEDETDVINWEPGTMEVQSSEHTADNSLTGTQTSLPPGNTASAWRSTIFGPLYLGVDMYHQRQEKISDSSSTASRSPFALLLGPSIIVPIIFKDVYRIDGSASIDNIASDAQNGPTGKLYSGELAIKLGETLRGTGGARVTVDSANEVQKDHFEDFQKRLSSNGMFVHMSGSATLAFFSSENIALCQRLAVPSSLRGLSQEIIVSLVSIENNSAYAECVIQAGDI